MESVDVRMREMIRKCQIAVGYCAITCALLLLSGCQTNSPYAERDWEKEQELWRKHQDEEARHGWFRDDEKTTVWLYENTNTTLKIGFDPFD